MRWFVALLVVGSAACGDDLMPDAPPLAPTANLTIVAHQDDDLLFMQPDLADIADRRAGLTNLYVTAGNGSGGVDVADERNAGVMEAYAEASGVKSSWTCGAIELAGRTAEHCVLDEAPISLVFLALPDGGKEGEHATSLLHLFDGSVSSVETVARRPARYDRAGVIAAVAEVITTTQPTVIRALEIAGTHGRDHSDHLMAGALAVLASAEAGYAGQLLSFRGYANELEPENVRGALYDRSANLLAHYLACTTECSASCGTACSTISEAHTTWLHRRYAVGFRSDVRGALRSGDRCLQGSAAGLTLGADCEQQVELTEAGNLRVGGGCVTARDDGRLVVTPTCELGAASRFYLDDEGHLWSGAPLDALSVTMGTRLRCLLPDGDDVIAGPCGAEGAPTWELTGTATTLPRPGWLPAPGRAVRVDGGRIYAVVDGTLRQAESTPTGFEPPVDLGALAVEPESLIVGVLDGKLRACGRDPDGVVCTALGSTAPERWSPTFARSGPATEGDRSLSGFGTEICGLAAEGVTCAPRGLSLVTSVRSRWPRADAPLWIGDLDGDGSADWCSATPSGIACGRNADRTLTTDGVPWSFARIGVVEPAPASASVAALYDLDADGRADLCTVEDRRVMCARSQGHGFGPRLVIGTLPPGGPAVGLWIDRGRACVDDGTTLACVELPRR